MDVINTTPLSSHIFVGISLDYDGARRAVLAAKATFLMDEQGRVALDSEDAFPVFEADEETPLGVLPSELPGGSGPEFEVMMLGAAYAPGGQRVAELTVTLSLGAVQRQLRVVGDRRWVSTPDGEVLTEPVPFVRMPLVWERAFGGTAEVWIDERSVTEVRHPLNPRGRGFDPRSGIENLGGMLYVADGFPRTSYERWAPNLESPQAPVRASSDAPSPICFAPLPMDSGLGLSEMAKVWETDPNDEAGAVAAGSRRVIPDLIFPDSPVGQTIGVTHCCPTGDFRFVMPTQRPHMDYVMGGRTGTRELTPRRLVLLPDERRFYVLYTREFMFQPESSDERSIRLRYE